MNVAIFGASGATGRLLTKRCVEAGHQVSVLIRPEARFPSHSQVCIGRGSVFDEFAIANTIMGADVVFSTLGARSLRNERVLETAVPLIINAMQQTGRNHKPVRRIIVLGSAGAHADSLDNQPEWNRWFAHKIIYKTLLRWPVAAQIAQYKALAASNLDWTMVMPPMLTNKPAKGSYRVDPDHLPRHGNYIARADVADFMMFLAFNDSRQWYGKGVYISY